MMLVTWITSEARHNLLIKIQLYKDCNCYFQEVSILKWRGKTELVPLFSEQPVRKSGTRGATLKVRPLPLTRLSPDSYINLEENSAKTSPFRRRKEIFN